MDVYWNEKYVNKFFQKLKSGCPYPHTVLHYEPLALPLQEQLLRPLDPVSVRDLRRTLIPQSTVHRGRIPQIGQTTGPLAQALVAEEAVLSQRRVRPVATSCQHDLSPSCETSSPGSSRLANDLTNDLVSLASGRLLLPGVPLLDEPTADFVLSPRLWREVGVDFGQSREVAPTSWALRSFCFVLLSPPFHLYYVVWKRKWVVVVKVFDKRLIARK